MLYAERERLCGCSLSFFGGEVWKRCGTPEAEKGDSQGDVESPHVETVVLLIVLYMMEKVNIVSVNHICCVRFEY